MDNSPLPNYRAITYRYSTGNGFNASLDTPSHPNDVSGFKGKPLMHNLMYAEVRVNLNREADRISMQIEDLLRQIKTQENSTSLGSDLTVLRKRVDLLSKLMLKFGVKFVSRDDLESLYDLNQKGDPGASSLISKIVAYNKPQKIAPTIDIGNRFDPFGAKLTKSDKKLFKDSVKSAKTLSGYGDLSLSTIFGSFVILYLTYKVICC